MKKIANPLVRAFVHETLKDSHSYSYSYDSYSVAAGQPCRLWLVKSQAMAGGQPGYVTIIPPPAPTTPSPPPTQ